VHSAAWSWPHRRQRSTTGSHHLIIIQLDAADAGTEHVGHLRPTGLNGFVCRGCQIPVGLVAAQDLQDLLAQLKTQELRQESAPGRLLTPRRRADDDAPVVVMHLCDGPSATAQQETTHALHQPVDAGHQALEREALRADALVDGQARPGVPIYPEISNNIQIMLGQVLSGASSPEEALDEAAAAVAAAYERL